MAFFFVAYLVFSFHIPLSYALCPYIYKCTIYTLFCCDFVIASIFIFFPMLFVITWWSFYILPTFKVCEHVFGPSFQRYLKILKMIASQFTCTGKCIKKFFYIILFICMHGLISFSYHLCIIDLKSSDILLLSSVTFRGHNSPMGLEKIVTWGRENRHVWWTNLTCILDLKTKSRKVVYYGIHLIVSLYHCVIGVYLSSSLLYLYVLVYWNFYHVLSSLYVYSCVLWYLKCTFPPILLDIHLRFIIICTSLWIWSLDLIGTNWWKCKHSFEKI